MVVQVAEPVGVPLVKRDAFARLRERDGVNFNDRDDAYIIVSPSFAIFALHRWANVDFGKSLREDAACEKAREGGQAYTQFLTANAPSIRELGSTEPTAPRRPNGEIGTRNVL